jgi:hypothetical protein
MLIDSQFNLNYSSNDYIETDGWTLYKENSITSLNKLPVIVLDAFSTAKISWEPCYYNITPQQLIESLIVDGSVVIKGGEIEHSDDWEVISKEYATERDDDLYKVYSLDKNQWHLWVYENDKEGAKLLGEYKLPFEDLFLYPNGTGILTPVQFTYRRMEEIEKTNRQQSTEVALSLVIAGNLGLDKHQIAAEVSGGAKLLFVPGTDIQITRVANTTLSEQLIHELDMLLPIYLKSTNVPAYDITTQQPISGLSKAMSLLQTTKYVKELQGYCKDIWETLGGEITFGFVTIYTPEEKLKELEFMTALKSLGYYKTDEEFFKALEDKDII